MYSEHYQEQKIVPGQEKISEERRAIMLERIPPSFGYGLIFIERSYPERDDVLSNLFHLTASLSQSDCMHI